MLVAQLAESRHEMPADETAAASDQNSLAAHAG